jgi:predicted lipoprotein with Yx(FWY)xxD motif
MRSSRPLAVLAVVVLALALAACGSSKKSSSSAQPASAYGESSSPSPSSATTEIKTASGKLGKYLVDRSGRSLYLFLLDKHGKSACSGPCLKAWPLYGGDAKPKAGTGVDAAQIKLVTRSDGAKQVSYGKYPLYYYAGDKKPGDITGQGLKQFGAPWYLVRPSGAKYDTD